MARHLRRDLAMERRESGVTAGVTTTATDRLLLRPFAPLAFQMDEIAAIGDAERSFLRHTAPWAIQHGGVR